MIVAGYIPAIASAKSLQNSTVLRRSRADAFFPQRPKLTLQSSQWWYRPALLHDGSVASLEEMFDPDRLKPDHVPAAGKDRESSKRAIPGHPFGLALNAEDKNALLAFLRTL